MLRHLDLGSRTWTQARTQDSGALGPGLQGAGGVGFSVRQRPWALHRGPPKRARVCAHSGKGAAAASLPRCLPAGHSCLDLLQPGHPGTGHPGEHSPGAVCSHLSHAPNVEGCQANFGLWRIGWACAPGTAGSCGPELASGEAGLAFPSPALLAVSMRAPRQGAQGPESTHCCGEG